MITIKPYKPYEESESYRLGFVVEGHADFAPHGQDIVCAGVSAIVQTTILGLDHYNPVEVTKRSGFIRVHVTMDDHTSDAIIKTMLLGLTQLEKQFPEHITIKETEETM